MKYRKYYVLLLLISAVLFNACKENTSEPEQQVNLTGNYFPNSNGTSFKYALEVTDSAGTKSNATRTSTYQGTKAMGTSTYQVQIDSVEYVTLPVAVTNNSYVRVTKGSDNSPNGVFYFVDTTGFSLYVPAQYSSYISFDHEMQLLSNSKEWDVFKLKLQYGIIGLEIIKVNATFTGTESVQLNLSSGTVSKEASKIHYLLTLQIPNPDDLTDIQKVEYTADLWVVKDIGIVKWQGSAAVLSAFTGSGIDIFNKSVVTQSLIHYSIK